MSYLYKQKKNIICNSNLRRSLYFRRKIMICYTIIDKNRFDDFSHLKQEIVSTIGH